MQRAELPCAVLAGRDRAVFAAGGVFGARVPGGTHVESWNRNVETVETCVADCSLAEDVVLLVFLLLSFSDVRVLDLSGARSPRG